VGPIADSGYTAVLRPKNRGASTPPAKLRQNQQNVSRRTERVASVIRRVLAEAIQHELHDPRIERMTSITRVEVSPDMSVAKVFVSVMAKEARRKLTVEALQHAAGRLRSRLGEELRVRSLPAVVFRLDESLHRGFETLQLLDASLEQDGITQTEDDDGQDAWAESQSETAAADVDAAGDAPHNTKSDEEPAR
jgi:ribosome-binding factor A